MHLSATFSIACALAFAWLGDVRAVVAPVALAWGVVVLATRAPAGPAWAWALAVRLPLLLVAPTLSDDVWRYVWEGEVWAAGANPFVHAPDDPALAQLRDEVWANVNHRHVPTVYPPLAQALFFALAPGGVLAWRVFATACDVATAHLLARRDPRAGATWALLPLPAMESAISGHLEGPGVMLMVLALGGSDAAAWAAAMIKLLPGVLLARARRPFVWALATAIVCAPVIRLDGLRTYGEKWAYNASLFALVPSRPLLGAVGAAIVAWILWRSRDRARVALWATGAFVLLSPVVHPWYVLWPLAAALWNGMRAWAVLAATSPFAYVVLATYDPATSTWEEPTWARLVVYVPFYAALVVEAWRRLTRAGPSPVH
ncbi:MAG: hypothetical protein ACOZNI_19005 [Myxococcota bacterium]